MPIGLQNTVTGKPLTVLGLILKSFKSARILGDGETPTTSETVDAFDLLNGIIEQANIDKLFGSYETEILFTLTPDKVSYTIGPASALPDVTAVRPVEVLNAFSRRGNIDIPMLVTHQKEDYDRIQMKSVGISGWEQLLYYQASYPAGTAYFFQQPKDGLTEAHLTVKANIESYTGLGDTIDLPPGYRTWLQYKLAQRLCPEYGMQWPEQSHAILIEAEASLKANNIKPFPRANSGVSGLVRSGIGSYNVYADTTRGT